MLYLRGGALGVDVEGRQIGGIGGAAVALGERAEGLQPLGDRRREAALAAALRGGQGGKA
jgi:hypothetical protein